MWINLEYLSAEVFVERNHRLPSPRLSGRAGDWVQWTFHPGFTPATGGLLREDGLADRQRRFARAVWLESIDAGARSMETGERVVSLFCYANPALEHLIDALSAQPTLLLVAAGAPSSQVAALLGTGLQRGALRARLLPPLSQVDFDHLLWACDLNFVRGEDTFVRAQWAGVPFVWQLYPQHDGVHAGKLAAFLDRFLPPATEAPAVDIRRLFTAWNALGPWPATLPDAGAWRTLCAAWRETLLGQSDLCAQLLGFVRQRR